MNQSILFCVFLIGFFGISSCNGKVTSSSSDTATNIESKTENLAIIGKWSLTAIKFYPRDEIIIPTKDYWVKFAGEGRLIFKLEANTCNAKYKTSRRNELTINNQIACTKMCCDGDISNKLNYEDVREYLVEGDKLKLTAKDRKFEFIRAKEN